MIYTHFFPAETVKEKKEPDITEYRIIAATAALQFDRRDLKVLVISSELNELSEEIKKYTSPRKAEYVSLHSFQYKGLPKYKKFDLIIVELPYPDTLRNCIYYSMSFWNKTYSYLGPDGVLAAALPCSAESQSHINIYYQTASILRSIFPSVKPGPGKTNLLLCGGTNISGGPSELDLRTEKITNESVPLPQGLFSIISTQEEYASKYAIFPYMLQEVSKSSFDHYTLFKEHINSQSNMQWFCEILEYTGKYSTVLTIILCISILVIRYFYSAGGKKDQFKSMENGFFAGTLLFLMLIHFHAYPALYLIFTFLCGALFSFCIKKTAGQWQIRIAGLGGMLALISAGYLPDDIWGLAVSFAGGFSFGTETMSLSKSGSLQYLGIATGILCGLFLFYNEAGIVLLIIYGILTKISAVYREDEKRICSNTSL